MSKEQHVVKHLETPRGRVTAMFESFFHYEASGGVLLFLAAALALLIANFGGGDWYEHVKHLPVELSFGEVSTEKSLLHWVNDGAMVLFFLLVGLEIKREFVKGELSNRRQAALPLIAAFFGVMTPALIYVAINLNSPETLRGWAIPAATDIAFAIGIIALFGKRVPTALRVLLVAIAVIDDLMAILIIALFYAQALSFSMLALAGVCLVILLVLNLTHVNHIPTYLFVGFWLWFFVLNSGVHATLAGVLLALLIPLDSNPESRARNVATPAHRIEHALLVPVNFLILPVFGFLNAGVNIAAIGGAEPSLWYTGPVFLGVSLGLFFGKQIGIFSSIYVLVKIGFSKMPTRCTWPMIYAMALLCGIGFTMSLFIGGLSFGEGVASSEMRLGVLVGSSVSCLIGAAILGLVPKKAQAPRAQKVPTA